MPEPITLLYLDTAAAVADFLGSPEVSAAWGRPSALAEMTVAGLAGHLARQVTMVPELLARGTDGHEVLSIEQHYDRSAWRDAPLDGEANAQIRRGSEREAAKGPVELAVRTAGVAAGLRESLFALPGDRQVFIPWGPWCLTLCDYLTTRLLEMVVHGDDLAVSVGARAALPEQATGTVLALLTRLAARRHGPEALLRAFTRRERAPESIVVF
jgi:hypothetical protein